LRKISLKETDCLRFAPAERSGGQKGRKLGGRNFYPPSFFAAAELRANEAGAPPIIN